MQVLNIEELEDGSAIIELEINQEEKERFLEYGIIQAIKQGIETMEDFKECE
jgi:hypothetical protein